MSCTEPKTKVDLIVKKAKIYTVNQNFQIAECIAVKDGKFVAVGTNSEILHKYSSVCVIDAKGKYIYPGLIDAHCHFLGYALSLQYADLTNATSFEDVLKIIQEHHKKFPTDWLVGRGWDQNKWGNKMFPDNKELDKLFPDIPVVLKRVDGHALLANSKALQIAGFTKNTRIDGGKIEIRNGKLTGILLDKACDSIRSIIPLPDEQDLTNLLIKAQNNCFAVGLTSVADAGLDYKDIKLYDTLHKQGVLKMKIYAMLNPTAENLENFMYKGFYKTDFLNVRSIKLFADGALGSRGALLLQPYSDDRNNYGILVEKPDSLRKIIRRAHKYYYQVNTHAIGDSAVRMVLNIYGEFLKDTNNLRWRIEHSQVVNSDDFELYKKYSVIPSVNAVHATSDMYWAEARLGKERIKTAYAYKQLLEQNGWLCNGSDFPVEDINPLYGFYAAVVRRDLNGFPLNGFQKENALTREQSLKAMTIWAAKACFEEQEKGSIEVGKFADFIITDEDFISIDENKIPRVKILATFINGQRIFGSGEKVWGVE